MIAQKIATNVHMITPWNIIFFYMKIKQNKNHIITSIIREPESECDLDLLDEQSRLFCKALVF